jgi:hypothetical protein
MFSLLSRADIHPVGVGAGADDSDREDGKEVGAVVVQLGDGEHDRIPLDLIVGDDDILFGSDWVYRNCAGIYPVMTVQTSLASLP